jgi:Pilus assembly protein, PilO
MSPSSRQFRLIAAFAGLNILLVVLGWVALVAPQRHAAATAAAGVQLAQGQLEALHPGSSHGPTKQPVVHSSCIYRLDTALPSQPDQTDLIFELQRVAKASGVKILGISPQVAQAMASGYTVQPINLSLTGSYFAVTQYLHSLRMLVSAGRGCPAAKGPLFAVTSVSFSGAGTSKSVPATAGIEAFYYGVTAGATAPVNTTATDTTTTTGS